jgi:hypothetical protein
LIECAAAEFSHSDAVPARSAPAASLLIKSDLRGRGQGVIFFQEPQWRPPPRRKSDELDATSHVDEHNRDCGMRGCSARVEAYAGSG